jgi:cytidylate kinase
MGFNLANMIIAMDGPAGAGKSSVARRVAKELGFAFLDTGAMYRAITLVVLERDIHPSDAEACTQVAEVVGLSFDIEGNILIDGNRGEPEIRTRTVTLNVSAVSAHAGVREAIVSQQRAIGERLKNVVAEGRDTTTVVFPEAEHKFFLVASPGERARRRARQEGTPERVEVILHDIERRDRLDATRAHSPLLQAPDALLIEADDLTIAEVVGQVLSRIRGEHV